MTKETNNKPVDTLRDGGIKASIWANDTDEGRIRYSVSLVRSYTDASGNWQDTNQYSATELLRAARLAEKAYDRVAELRAEM